MNHGMSRVVVIRLKKIDDPSDGGTDTALIPGVKVGALYQFHPDDTGRKSL